MSITVKFSEKDLENLDNLESDYPERIDMKGIWGMYEVRVGKIIE